MNSDAMTSDLALLTFTLTVQICDKLIICVHWVKPGRKKVF